MKSSAWDSIAALIGSDPKPAYLTVTVSGSSGSEGENPYVSGSAEENPRPGNIGVRVSGGVNFSYQSTSYGSAEDNLHLTSTNGTLTYTVTGQVTQPDDQTVEVQARTVLYVDTNVHAVGVDVQSASGNLIDQTWRASYHVAPSSTRAGYVTVVMTTPQPINDSSQAMSFQMDCNQALQAAQAGARDAVSGLEGVIAYAMGKNGHPQPKVRTQTSRARPAP